MKVMLFGKTSKNIEGLVKELGFEIVSKNLFESEPEGSSLRVERPDLLITYGGDGTLLSAERQFPGIPKLPIRNSDICKKCSKHLDKKVLESLKLNKLKLTKYKKLQTEVKGQKFYALNDFVVRNSDPTHTIRFRVHTPLSSRRMSGSINNLLIGDGIVVATPFGSTGYFKSITGQTFSHGFGLAFNNTTEKVKPEFLNDSTTLTFKLVRGKATLSFDNSPDIFTIDEESGLVFKLSDQVAKIYEDTSLRCPNCEVIRG